MARSSRATLIVRLALLLILVVLCAYAVTQRSAARAGVDQLTFIPRFGEGFLCIGMCRDKPGVVILSRLSRDDVAVHAQTESLSRRTTLSIERNGQVESHRLEQPAVVLIDESDAVRIIPVDWDAHTFSAILQAVNCDGEHYSSTEHPRCGIPFIDLMEFLGKHPPGKIPPELAAFAQDRSGE
ncbi:MAG: hypothetical protein ACYSVY_23485 [Planctomycetota bacterium]|jgi:hypothetical protein